MTDAIVIGGNIGGTRQVTTEEYNGTSWATGGSLDEARETGASVGDSSNCRYVNGYTINPTPYPNSDDNDEYNGTSWATDANCPTSTNNVVQSHIGGVSSMRVVGGHRNGTGNTNRNNKFNGTSWSSDTVQNFTDNIQANGTLNDCLIINGGTGTYEWNGSSWGAGATVDVNRKFAGGSGGTSSCISCGGTGGGNTTSVFNGSSWSSGASFTYANHNTPTAGTPDNSESMMICGGMDPTASYARSSTCEELSGGVFISVTSLGSARGNSGCAGTSI